MLRPYILVVIALGLLVSCGPSQTGAGEPQAPVGQTRQSAVSARPKRTFTWSGASNGCLVCSGTTTYACYNPGDSLWTKSYLDDIPAGLLVTKVEAMAYGSSIAKNGQDTTARTVGVHLNNTTTTANIGSYTSDAPRACTGQGVPSCDGAKTVMQNFASGLSGYNYRGTNSFRLAPNDDYCISYVELVLTVSQQSISPDKSTVAFGDQRRGVQSAAQTVTITNDGDVPFTVSSVTTSSVTTFPISGITNSSGVSLGTGTSPFTLAVGATATIAVRFTPPSAGSFNGTLTINSSNTNAPAATVVTLTGTGISSLYSEPAAPDFGTRKTGTNTLLTVRLRNDTLSAVTATAFSLSGPYTFATPAPQNFQITPATPLDLEVSFNPTAVGTFPGTLTVTTNEGPSGAAATFTVPLTGVGVDSAVVLSPPTLSFGSQRVNTSSTPQALELRNVSSATLTVSAITPTGSYTYTVSPAATPPFTIPAGGKRDIMVTFSPTVPGSAPGSLAFTTNEPSQPSTTVTATFTGTAVNPTLGVGPTSWTFPDQRVGTPSAPKRFTLGNGGSEGALIVQLPITATGPYTIVTQPSGTSVSLAPGQSFDIDVVFNPTEAGSAPGSLSISSNDPINPRTILLAGTGVNPTLSVNPTSWAFPDQRVGVPSATKRFVVSNSGGAGDLVIALPITVSGPYSLVNPPTGTSVTLAPNQTLDLDVRFTPTAPGSAPGSLSLASNDPLSPKVVTLSGTGVDPTLTVTPTTWDFTEQRVGVASTAKRFIVSNSGGAGNLVINLPVTVSGPFNLVSPPSGTSVTLAPGATLNLDVTFTPPTPGAKTGSLSLASNDSSSPKVVSLSGTGVNPTVSVNPASWGFGDQRVNTPSAPRRFVVSNSGGAGNLVINPSITVTGPFQLTNPPASEVTLAPGDFLNLDVTFTPTTHGPASGSLSIASNDSTSPKLVPLTGNGINPTLAVTPTSWGFGQQRVGTISAPKRFVLSNGGDNGALNITLPITVSGPFAIVTQPSGTTVSLAPGQTLDLDVTFNPTLLGPANGSLSISSNDPGSPRTVALTGTGSNAALTVTPGSWTFPDQRVSTTSAPKMIRLENSGTVGTLTIGTPITLSGPFGLVTPPTSPVSLEPGQTMDLNVTFSPITPGTVAGSLSLSSNDPASPRLVTLSGTGVNPTLGVTPTSWSFGQQRVGTTSTAKRFTVTNSGGNGALNIAVPITVTGPFAIVTQPSGPVSLAPGERLDVDVTFNPQSPGALTGSLSFASNDPASPTVVALDGTGVNPTLSVNPTSVNFMDQRVNVQSTARTVRVTNSGSVGALIVDVPSIVSGPFALVSPPNAAVTLAPGEHRDFDVTFTPTAPGPASGSLRFTSNDPAPATLVPLSGNGVDQALVVAPSPLDFGEQRVDTTSAPRSVRISNGGTVGSLTFSVPGTVTGPFALVSPPSSPVTLAPGEHRDIDVTFTPTSAGSNITGSFALSSNVPGGPTSVALRGVGVNSALSVTPSSLSYGQVYVNTTSAAQQVMVSNSGTVGSLQVTAINLPAPYALVAPPTLPITLAPGESRTLNVTFTPNAETPFSGNLTVTGGNPATTSTVTLSGNGVKPILELSRTAIGFGDQYVNTSSAAQAVVVRNAGTTGTLRVTALDIAAPFALVSPPSLPFTLEPGTTRTLNVTFSPGTEAPFAGALTVTSNDPDTSRPTTVTLSGNGVRPVLAVSPGTLAFGQRFVGTTSAAQQLVVSNSGTTGTLQITAITVPAPYALVSPPALPFNLAAGETRTLGVTFAPTLEQAYPRTLTVTSNNPSSSSNVSANVALTGSGVRPILALSPSSLAFGQQYVNTASPIQEVTVRNAGSTGTLRVTALNIAAPFGLVTPPALPLALEPNETATLRVTFTPGVEQAFTGALSLTTNDEDVSHPSSVPLTGTGVRPVLELDPNAIAFGDLRVGNSTTRTVTVRNGGSGTLRVTAFSIAAPYSLVAPPSLPLTLEPTQSTTLTVAFAPGSEANFPGALVLTHNDPASNGRVTLTGAGVRPVLELTPNPLVFGEQRTGTTSTARTITVRNAGQSGTLEITGLNLDGRFALVAPPVLPFNLTPNETRALMVTFSPNAETAFTGTLTVSSNDPNLANSTASLTGSGVRPMLQLSPTLLAFGEQRVDVTSAPMSLIVRNTGTTGQLEVSSLGIAAPFAMASPPTLPFTVAPGGQRVLQVTYTPTAETSSTSTLNVGSNDPDSAANVTLTGNGVLPVMVLNPTALDFGEQRVNAGGVSRTVTIRNNGTGTLELGSISVSGTNASSYAVAPTSLSVPPGESRTVTVIFTPNNTGALVANLMLAEVGRPAVAVPLSGIGVQPILFSSPNSLDFRDRAVGSSTSLSLTVTNTGSGTLRVGAPAITAGKPYTVIPSGPFELAANASQTLNVTFSPTTLGDATANLTLTSNEVGRPNVSIPLTGFGVAYLETTPASALSFGPRTVGTSTSLPVVISNHSPTPINLQAVTVAAPFSVPDLTTPREIPANSSLTFTVVFSPTARGAFNQPLTLVSNAFNSNHVLTLTGSGGAPTIDFSPATMSFSADVGATSQPQTVTLRNTGEELLRVTGVTINSPAFQVISGLNVPFTVPAGGTHDFQVVFSSNTLGSFQGQLSLTSDAINSNAAVQLNGSTHGGRLLVSPNPVAFPATALNTTSSAITVTLSNTGDRNIVLGNTVSSSALFTVGGTLSGTIAPGASISQTVTFRPTSCAEVQAPLNFLASTPYVGPTSVVMRGAGNCPALTYSFPNGDAGSTTLNFGDVRVGATLLKQVLLKNEGGAPYNLTAVTLSSAPAASPFRYLGLTPQTIQPGAVVSFQMGFNPTQVGIANDALRLSSDSNSPVTLIPVAGNGTKSELSLDRSSVFFGDVRVGEPSDPVNVKITNTGSAQLTILGLSVNGPFAVSGLDASTRVPVGGDHTFSVTFRPTKEGPPCTLETEQCNISIISDANSAGTVLAMNGNGTVSRISLSTTTLSFGAQRALEPSGVRPIIVTNTGRATLVISEFILTSSMFTIATSGTDGGSLLPLTIRAGEQKAVSVIFTPTRLGNVSAELYIVSNAYETPAPLALSGEGVDGQSSTTPSVVEFGETDVGTSGRQASVMLRNTGGYPLTITEVVAPTATAFTVSGLSPGLVLRPNEQWPFTVTFAPRARGYQTGTVVVRTDARINSTFNLSVTGTGVAAAVDLVPRDINFGKSNVAVSTTQSISIKNIGERDLYISNITFADAAGGAVGAALDFSLGNTGPDAGVTFPLVVARGGSLLVPLKFTPRAMGLRTAQAVVFTNDVVTRANLEGEGTSPNLTLSVSSLDFGNVLVGKHSAPRVLTLTNTGNGPLSINTVSLTGADAASFVLATAQLPVVLQPEASTDVSLTLKPDSERQFTAQVVVETNDPDAPGVQVPMVGVGVHQQITLSPTALDFGAQLINNKSNARTVQFKNGSDANVTLTALAVDGPGSSQYAWERLTLPLVVGPGKTQDVAVTFTPLADPEVTCTLKLTFSDLPEPLSVTLRGKGIPAVISIKPSPLDFRAVRIGGPVRELPLTITNLSNDPVKLAAPKVTYSTGVPFIFNPDSVFNQELQPGKSLIVTMGYQPDVATLSEATLSFGTLIPQVPQTVDVQLQGKGLERLLSADQGNLEFGFTKLGESAEPKVITLTNLSSQKQRIVLKMRDLVEDPPFTLVIPKTTLDDGIPPGGSVPIQVVFGPKAPGQVSNEVEVWLQDGTSAELTVPVTGYGQGIIIDGGGCSCGTTNAASAALLALVTLAGLRLQRRRRG